MRPYNDDNKPKKEEPMHKSLLRWMHISKKPKTPTPQSEPIHASPPLAHLRPGIPKSPAHPPRSYHELHRSHTQSDLTQNDGTVQFVFMPSVDGPKM